MFWNWTHKNIPDRQHSARFRKSLKSSISLHPTPHPTPTPTTFTAQTSLQLISLGLFFLQSSGFVETVSLTIVRNVVAKWFVFQPA